jgi:hypothetical protein
MKRMKEWGKGSTWLGKGGDDTIGGEVGKYVSRWDE